MTWLESVMKRYGITYGQLSRRSGISKSVIWGIAVNGRDARLSTLRKLAATLDMPIGEMVDEGTGKPLAEWYFTIWTQIYGADTWGPYTSRGAAEQAIAKTKVHVAEVPDNIHRAYTEPYRK